MHSTYTDQGGRAAERGHHREHGHDRHFDEGWGGRGGPGFGGRRGPRVDRGEVKYLILSVLQDGPKHGYEIMRSLEEKSQGAYAPSAGTIYPTLQMLEDMTYLQGRETDGRKVFALTDPGRAFLAEHVEETKTAWGRFAEEAGPAGEGKRLLRDESSALARTLFADERLFRANPETLEQVRAILKNARQQIHLALAQDG